MADVTNSKILQQIEGIQHIQDALVVIIKTEWNAAIVDELEKGCQQILEQHHIKFKTVSVPGAIEIPFAITQYWAGSHAPWAFIAIGAVVRGDTPHFDYVCQSVTSGITQLNLSLPVPVIFGILTVDNEQQAKQRIGGTHGHKGEEAAITAIKMIILNQQLKEGEL